MQGATVVTSAGRFHIPARHGLDARQLPALIEAIHRFDRLLDAPLCVWSKGDLRGVDLLDRIRFTACDRSLSLGVAALQPDGKWRAVTYAHPMTVSPPLHHRNRMAWLLDSLDIAWRVPATRPVDRCDAEFDEFEAFDPGEADCEGPGELRFIELLHRQLRGDPRYRALRTAVMHALVGEEVSALAMRTGSFDVLHRFVTIRRLENVWRNLDRYREIARRAPQLLSLAGIALQELDPDTPAGEVLEAMRLAIRERGYGDSLGDACWQWLLRRGLRPLAPIFFDRPDRLTLGRICVMLEGIADAGWPDRLTPRFMRQWHALNTPYGPQAWESVSPQYWNLVRPSVLREMVVAQG